MEGFLISGQQVEGLLPGIVPGVTGGDDGRQALAHQALAQQALAQQTLAQQTLVAMFAEIDAAFARTARLLSPYEMHMAAFHLRLLQTELLKTEVDGRPSADIVMMAATWLLARVSGLTPELGRLLFSAAAMAVFRRAGETAVTWLDTRAAAYETEGQRVNLGQLRQGLVAYFAEDELRILCTDMGILYDQLYGSGKSEKVWEMVAYAVQYGRVLELAARCLERRPYGEN